MSILAKKSEFDETERYQHTVFYENDPRCPYNQEAAIRILSDNVSKILPLGTEYGIWRLDDPMGRGVSTCWRYPSKSEPANPMVVKLGVYIA